MTSVKLQYDDLMNPVIQALKSLGGSGTNEEINNKVAEIVKIPSDQLEVLHNQYHFQQQVRHFQEESKVLSSMP